VRHHGLLAWHSDDVAGEGGAVQHGEEVEIVGHLRLENAHGLLRARVMAACIGGVMECVALTLQGGRYSPGSVF
jgi:hypothetical protein